MLIGLPICTNFFFIAKAFLTHFPWSGRDPEYLKLNISFAASVFSMAAAMTAVPGFLRP
jgi:hypothetical protein